jgi:hypothetical protein
MNFEMKTQLLDLFDSKQIFEYSKFLKDHIKNIDFFCTKIKSLEEQINLLEFVNGTHLRKKGELK